MISWTIATQTFLHFFSHSHVHFHHRLNSYLILEKRGNRGGEKAENDVLFLVVGNMVGKTTAKGVENL